MLTISFWYGREGCHNSNIAWRHVGLFPTDRPSVPTVQEKKFFFKDFRLLWGIVSYFLSFSVEWKRKRNHFFTLRSFYSIMVFPSGDQIQLINNGSKKKKSSKMTGCLKCCWFDLNVVYRYWRKMALVRPIFGRRKIGSFSIEFLWNVRWSSSD